MAEPQEQQWNYGMSNYLSGRDEPTLRYMLPSQTRLEAAYAREDQDATSQSAYTYASSTQPSTYADTVFDRESRHGWPSARSVQSSRQDHVEQPAMDLQDAVVQPVPPQIPRFYLKCPFEDSFRCDVEFTEFEEEVWIRHSLSHFGKHGPPNRTVCMFCDEEFGAGDRYRSWANRMKHIARHLEAGKSIENRLADIDIINYCERRGLLSRRVSRAERQALVPSDPEFVAVPMPADYVPDFLVQKRAIDAQREDKLPVRERRRRDERSRLSSSGPPRATPSSSLKYVTAAPIIVRAEHTHRENGRAESSRVEDVGNEMSSTMVDSARQAEVEVLLG